jgi:hypothetical protein
LWLSPLWRGPDPLFEKLEFPSPKDNLYQVWLNMACWFWRRRFLKIFSVFLLFRYYLPLEKGYPLRLNKLESPPPKDDLCQVYLKLVMWFWRRSRKCKSLQTDGQTDGQTDAGQRAIRKAHLSFQLRWAKNKNKQTKGKNPQIVLYVVNLNFKLFLLSVIRLTKGKANVSFTFIQCNFNFFMCKFIAYLQHTNSKQILICF